jgi:hypothetical protein
MFYSQKIDDVSSLLDIIANAAMHNVGRYPIQL